MVPSQEVAVSWVQHQVADNEMLIALVAAMLLGSALYFLRSIPSALWKLFMMQFTVSLTVYNETSDYQELLGFLVSRRLLHHRVRRLTMDRRVSYEVNQLSADGDDPSHLTIGGGKHFFYYRGRPFMIEHEIGEAKGNQRPRTLVLRTFGRSRSIMGTLCDEVNRAREHEKDFIDVYSYGDGYWARITRRTKRPLDTIVIDPQQKRAILDDIEWFRGNESWYRVRGIPYRRGYFFHGPPGTGKTSFIFALASHYGAPVYMLNPGVLKSDDMLLEAFGEVPRGAFLLIEDIDATRANTRPRTDGDDSGTWKGVSLSGLMNALDGIASPDHLVLFMTTNHPENIEPALLRPGRVDRKEQIGYPGHDEAVAMFRRFFPHVDLDRATAFAERHMEHGPYTAADLQEHCLEHADNADAAVRQLGAE